MNKFNEQTQIEETTLYETGELMNETLLGLDLYLNNELQNKINKLDKPTGDGFTEYKLTLDESSAGQWQVTIHEYYAPLSDRTFSVNYSATFNNLTNGGSHQELFPILKSAGEFLLGKIDQYYQQHGDASNATAQLNAEDAIDTLTH